MKKWIEFVPSKSVFLVLFLLFQSVFVYADCRIDILQLNSKNGSTGFFRVNKTITLECERFLEKNSPRMKVELDSNGFFRYQGADGWLLLP